MYFLLLLLFCFDVADMTGFTGVVPDEKHHLEKEGETFQLGSIHIEHCYQSFIEINAHSCGLKYAFIHIHSNRHGSSWL